MHRLTLRAATWIVSRLVPREDRESLIGDLEEEYALRVRVESPSAAQKWYMRQVCSSTPPILWIRLARGAPFATLGVALAGYVAVGLMQLVVYWAIPTSAAPVYNPLGVIVLFPIVVLIGYFAERSRRRASVVLGAIMLLAITAMTLWVAESLPLWYRTAYFLVGPLGALIGGALRRAPYQASRK